MLADATYNYGNHKMMLEIIDLIEEFKLKPNAAIMTYMLNCISKGD